MNWQLRDRVLPCDKRAWVLGIVNVTPDSFSDGGRHQSTEQAVAHAQKLVEEGADLLDIGGESTRPGSLPVPLAEELSRVVPVVQTLVKLVQVPLSIDTSKAEVARVCLAEGASIINDVTGLQGDPELVGVVAKQRAGVIVMHMQGTPATMQNAPSYTDVLAEVQAFFAERLSTLQAQGIAVEQIVLDPGIGFGKRDEHNLCLLARLAEFGRLGRPICLGVSRKGVLGRLLNRPVEQRLASSLAVVCDALSQGAAQIVRVHDVAETRDAVLLLSALRERRLR